MVSVVIFGFGTHLIRGMTVQPAPGPTVVGIPHWSHEPMINIGDPVQPEIPHVLYHRLIEAPVPFVDISVDQHNLGFGIRLDQLFCKRTGRQLTGGTEVVKELVPFDPRKRRTFVEVLGIEGLIPHLGVTNVGGEPQEGMIASAAEKVQSGLHGYSEISGGNHLGITGRSPLAVPVRGNPRLKTSIGISRLAPFGETLRTGMNSSGCRSWGVDILMASATHLTMGQYCCNCCSPNSWANRPFRKADE